MVDNKILIALAVIVVVALLAIAYLAVSGKRAATPGSNATTTIYSNQTSLANSTAIGAFNATSNQSLQDQALNGSVSQDQNESILSNGNLIAPP